MRYIGAFVAVLALLVVACGQQEAPVCSAPYILQDGKCCLDADNDTACDAKAAMPGQLDCSLCPPQFVTQKQEVIVYRYVCINESIVDDPGDCGAVSNAHLFTPRREQDDDYVREFSVTPACRGKFNAAQVYLAYEQVPLNITLQVLDDPQGEFEDAIALSVKPETYSYVGFCLDCQNLIDVQLAPDQAYLVRAALRYERFTIYTAEELIDPTPRGNIGRKVCS